MYRLTIFILCGLIAVFCLSGCAKTQSENKAKEGYKKIIKKKGYTVEVTMPFSEKKPLIPPLELKEENFNPDEVMKWFFKYPEEAKKLQKDKRVPVISYYSYKESEKYLEVYPHGLNYHEHIRYPLSNNKKFSLEEAVSMAKEYIVEHGGLPPVAHLQKASSLSYLPEGYYLIFTPEPVKGIDFYQNWIKIEITSKGVTNYNRNWRSVKKIKDNHARPILSPEEALSAFLKIDKIAIDELTLAYFGEVGYEHQLESIPIWIAWVRIQGEKESQMYIDAYTGRKLP